eukprot:scaffold13816_cov23-Cyclotella_meneghiniana.AAC.1
MPNNKKKNKSKRVDRNEKVTSCHGCSKHLHKKDFVYCICTHVRYCSDDCREWNPHRDCAGAPETKFSMGQMLRDIPAAERLSEGDSKRRRDVEIQETVTRPQMNYILSKGISFLKSSDLSVWDYALLADEGDALGNQALAYGAGSRFRHRLLGPPKLKVRDGDVTFRNSSKGVVPVLESQELAFKYFEKGAKLGHGLCMQSLGTCFDDGVGCKANRRRCNQWLWRACLHNSAGANELLEDRALLPLEINANFDMLEQAQMYLQPLQKMHVGGPNLGALLLAFNEVAQKLNYSLPPFRSSWATGKVNNPLIPMPRNKPRIPLIAAESIKKILIGIQPLKYHGNDVVFGYCRRGAAKTATSQTQGAASRVIDNQIFFAPPFAACDETIDVDDVHTWHAECIKVLNNGGNQLLRNIVCVHNERQRNSARNIFCNECEADAVERLDAICKGSVVISIDEEISQRGQSVIFRDKFGRLKQESWKAYSVGEAESVLAILAESGFSSYVAPLFIAQDPNFIWPLIADHGSVRAALEHVAPYTDWNAVIGQVRANICEQNPIEECSPGSYLRKCGNRFCTKFESYSDNMFSFCDKCNRRKYCGLSCQHADWPIHKLECRIGKGEREENLRLDVEALYDRQNLDLKHSLKLEHGQDCVVHGLKTSREYNGLVGTAGETSEDGRIAVTLSLNSKVLAVKPCNLYSIGVFCRKRKKKSRVFECAHGLEICKDCYSDLTTVNRLAKLKYNGEDISSPAAIDQVLNTYFSSCILNDDDDEQGNTVDTNELPWECQGMEEYPKQCFVLKALLTKKPVSLLAAVARTAIITFGAQKLKVLRPNTRLEDVAMLL